jgi:hypothetical protein
LVVEQDAGWLSGIVDRCYLLETGRVESEGDLEAILSGSAGKPVRPKASGIVPQTERTSL